MTSGDYGEKEEREGEELSPAKRKWTYFDYLDKVEKETQAGRFASQSK